MNEFLFSGPLYQLLYNVLVVLYHFLGDNVLLAIVGTALFSRLVMFPLTSKQSEMSLKAKEFQEKTKEIQEKYKKDKDKQQEELLNLQKEFLPGQIRGCLTLPIQLWFFINIYNVVLEIINKGIINFNKFAYSFVPQFGEGESVNFILFNGLLDLQKSPSSLGFEGFNFVPYILLLLLLGVSQYYSFKIMGVSNEETKKTIEKEESKKANKSKSEDDLESFGEIFKKSTQQAVFFMPVVITVLFYNLPSGLSIYLIASNLLVIIQQWVLLRLKSNEDLKIDLNKDKI